MTAAWKPGPFVALLVLALAACGTPVPTSPRPVVLSSATCERPVYPAEARRHGAEGGTVIEFDVNAEGRVTRVAIVGGSGETPGHRLLDAKALETVSKCKFPPAPGFLTATSRITYQWRLQD